MRQNVLLAVALCSHLMISGCGSEKVPNRDPVFPINGVITYKGRPVKGADVTFVCQEKDRSAFGRTDDNGAFQLTTYSSNDGAVAGKHTVVVQLVESIPAAKPEAPITSPDYQPPGPEDVARSMRPAKSGLPKKYADAKTSDLVAVINADGNNAEMKFDLKD
jgi:hypothetical protein